jgi:general secretion pathway protein K
MRRRSEEGIALIAVLWALILLSIIAASLSLVTRTDARIARNMADNAAARAAADAGIQRAILDLMAPDAEKKFRVDGTVYDWRFPNSYVRISVQDENGKVNLNRASEELLVALFASVGVDPGTAQSLADAIADFRDADHVRHINGAEDADYRTAGLPWGPKNAPFEDITELRQVLGMTPGIYERVVPNLTVYTLGTAINPDLASERLNGTLRQIRSRSVLGVSGIAYSIRAEAKGVNGGVFVREAVVQLGRTRIVAWRQGARKNADSYLGSMQGRQ